MTKTNDIYVVIYRHLTGEASGEDIRILREWTGLSEDNREKLLEMQNLWDMSGLPFDPTAIDPVAAYQKVAEKIRKPRRMPLWRVAQQIAAILFLPLLIASIYFYSDESKRAEVLYHELFTPYNTWSQIDLPDGSKVWLNAGSSIKYPTRFDKDERIVSINGEVYFEVESDNNHPFVVKAGGLTVRATGTQFNVNHYAADSVATVVLITGRVLVRHDNAVDAVTLLPGEMMNYNKNSHLTSVAVTDTYKWSAWRYGIMAFRDDPLDSIFKRLGQAYNVDFVIKDAELSDYLYRATFAGEPLDEILKLVEKSVPVRYREVSDRRSGNDLTEKRRIEVYKVQ